MWYVILNSVNFQLLQTMCTYVRKVMVYPKVNCFVCLAKFVVFTTALCDLWARKKVSKMQDNVISTQMEQNFDKI